MFDNFWKKNRNPNLLLSGLVFSLQSLYGLLPDLVS